MFISLHNEKLHGLHPSSLITWLIRSRKIRWHGHQHLWGEERCIQDFGGEL